MPKIEWTNLPPDLRDHLFERARERRITIEDLYQLKLWREGGPEAPEGPWYKDFGSFKICGEGRYPKTFLLRGQAVKEKKFAESHPIGSMPDVPITTSRSRREDIVFWDVDTQRDFMLPGGALYVPRAERIIPNLARLTQHARRHDILVVADVDAHHPDDPEFQQWPPHCLAGTPGQKKVHETELNVGCVIPNVPAELPNDFSQYEQIIIEKQTLDVFDNPNIDKLLKRIGKPEVVVYGVVTEICVSYAALGLLKRGYNIRLVTDAVRALDEKKAGAFMDEVERRGGKLVTTADVVRQIA